MHVTMALGPMRVYTCGRLHTYNVMIGGNSVFVTCVMTASNMYTAAGEVHREYCETNKSSQSQLQLAFKWQDKRATLTHLLYRRSSII